MSETPSRKGLKQSEHLPKAPHINVKVTASEIESASKKNSAHCMTAVAVTRLCKRRKVEAKHVSVDIQTIRFTDPAKGLRYVYLTPRTVQERIINWDQGNAVAPFSFVLKDGAVHPANVTSVNGKKSREAARRAKKRLRKAILRKSGAVPRVVGGREPPTVISSRREFGLRAFGGKAGEVVAK